MAEALEFALASWLAASLVLTPILGRLMNMNDRTPTPEEPR